MSHDHEPGGAEDCRVDACVGPSSPGPMTQGSRRAVAGALAFAALLLTLAVAAPARADGPEADRAAAEAREAVRHGQNADASALFQRAIALDPDRRLVWLRELADALSLSDRSRAALPLYREVLAAGRLSPQEIRWARLGLARALGWTGQLAASLRECDALIALDPRDVDARLRRAQVLLWLGRKGASKTEYEAVLRLDPNNMDALRYLGQVQSWRGQKQDARQRLAAFLREHPDDEEGAFLLAQTQAWMGRPDRARQTLEELLARHPGDARGRALLDAIRRSAQPEAGVDEQVSTQSDHLGIAVRSFQQDTPLHEGRTTVGARFQAYDYRPPAGQVPIVVNRPGLFARHRLSDRDEVTGSFFLDQIEPERRFTHRQILTYDTYYTLWPNDHFRIDLGSRRSTFDNISSLTRGITATYGTYSIDFLPDERTKLTTRGDWGGYTDGNRRRWTQIEAARQIWPNPHLFLGARYTDFTFSQRLNDGYYNPSSYRSTVLTFHLWGSRGERFYFDFDGAYGREHAHPGGGKPFSSLGATLSYQLKQRLRIEGRWEFFSSRQASGSGAEVSSSGFARHTVGLFVRWMM